MRIRQETVRFQNAFTLDGIEGKQPPGAYIVEFEEQLIEELSFPAYRRVATVIRLSPQAGWHEAVSIDPRDLDAALERDAMLTSISCPRSALDVATGDTNITGIAAPESASGPSAFSERFRAIASRVRQVGRSGILPS